MYADETERYCTCVYVGALFQQLTTVHHSVQEYCTSNDLRPLLDRAQKQPDRHDDHNFIKVGARKLAFVPAPSADRCTPTGSLCSPGNTASFHRPIAYSWHPWYKGFTKFGLVRMCMPCCDPFP